MKQLVVILSLLGALMLAAAEEAKTPEANRAEAARFFEEYRGKLKEVAFCKHPSGAERDMLMRLVDSACALDPENPRYRCEAIRLELSPIQDYWSGWSGKLELLRKFIDQADAFYKKYPDYRRPFMSGSFPCDFFGNLPVSRATAEQRAELSALFDRIRVFRDRENLQTDFYRGKFDLSDGIGSVRELYVYSEWVGGGIRYHWYYDTKKMVSDGYRQQLELLRAMRDYFRKHPEERKKKIHISSAFLLFTGGRDDTYLRKETIAGLEAIFADFSEVTELVREIDYPSVTSAYCRWLVFGEFLRSDRSDAALKEIMFRVYERDEAHPAEPGKFPKPEFELTYLGGLRMFTVVRNIRYQYLSEKKGEGGFRFFCENLYDECGDGNIERIACFVPELRKSALALICNNELHNAFGYIVGKLRKDESSLEKGMLLHELNSAFSIRQWEFPVGVCLRAVEWKERIFLLTIDYSSRLHVSRFDPRDMSTTQFPDPVKDSAKFQPRARDWGRPLAFSISAGRLVLGGRDAVALFNPDAWSWTLIEDLPGEDVISAVIVGGRCYCLLGGRPERGENPKLLSLCSFKLDGTDRKLHFSARRVEKLTPLDSLPRGKGTELIVLPGGKLMFCTVFFEDISTLWSFDPNTERFEKLHTFKNTFYMALRDQGDFVLGNCFGFGERFFTFDKKSRQITWFLTQSKDDTKWAKANNVRQLKGGGELSAPFLLDGDYLLSAFDSNCPLVLNLKNPEESPLLLVPGGVNVFRLEDGSWVFIGQEQLSVVKLK